MNKILIKCDGNEIILDTIRTVSDIARLLELNEHNNLLLINNKLLSDELFKEEIAINPSFVTLVKDITAKDTESIETREDTCLGNEEAIIQIDDNKLFQGLANKIARYGGN